jgi:hypothetical protein
MSNADATDISTDDELSVNLASDIDFTALTRLFEVDSEKPTEFTLRVTGHLWLNGVEVDTVDTTFKVTVTEATTDDADAAADASSTTDDASSTTAAAESTCSGLGYKPTTEKDGFPQFELTKVTDPSNGLPVEYTVNIPTKIQGIFKYDEGDLLIYSTVDTSETDFTGLFTITVMGTCDGEEN